MNKILNFEKIKSYLLKIIFLFPFITLFSFLDGIAGYIFYFIYLVFFMIYIVLNKKIEFILIILLIATLLLTLLNVVISSQIYFSKYSLFFILFVITILFFILEKNYILRFLSNYKYFHNYLLIWTLIVIASLFFKSSFITHEYYGYVYFVSFSGNQFRFGQSALFVLLISLLMGKMSKRNYLFSIIPVVSLAFSGSRSYFLFGILVIIYILLSYSRKSLRYLLVLLFLSFLVLMFSDLYDRFIDPFLNFNNSGIAGITSYRSDFWSSSFQTYIEGDFINKFFGYGINTSILLYHDIYSMNEFNFVLLSYGLIGIVIYILLIIIYLLKIFLKSNVSIFFVILYIIVYIIFSTLMLNMSYFASLITILLLPLVKQFKHQKIVNKEFIA